MSCYLSFKDGPISVSIFDCQLYVTRLRFGVCVCGVCVCVCEVAISHWYMYTCQISL